MTGQPVQGVYQDADGKWTWNDPESGKSGEPTDSREEARAAYLEHMRASIDDASSAAEDEPAPKPKAQKAPKPKAAKSATRPVAEISQPKKEKKMPSKKKGASKRTRDLENGPVAKARAIFKKLGRKAARKDVLAECVKAGINKFTAATYYQKFRSGGGK